MKTWNVTIPIAGHAYMTVDAETEAEAIELAMEQMTSDNIESWEPVERFTQGNVCYCPHPWEAEAEEEPTFEDEDE